MLCVLVRCRIIVNSGYFYENFHSETSRSLLCTVQDNYSVELYRFYHSLFFCKWTEYCYISIVNLAFRTMLEDLHFIKPIDVAVHSQWLIRSKKMIRALFGILAVACRYRFAVFGQDGGKRIMTSEHTRQIRAQSKATVANPTTWRIKPNMLCETGLSCSQGSTASFKGTVHSLYTNLENNQMSSEFDCLTYNGGRFKCTDGKLSMVECQASGGTVACPQFEPKP